jgi:hypothetical protein
MLLVFNCSMACYSIEIGPFVLAFVRLISRGIEHSRVCEALRYCSCGRVSSDGLGPTCRRRALRGNLRTSASSHSASETQAQVKSAYCVGRCLGLYEVEMILGVM